MAAKRNPLNWWYVGDTLRHVRAIHRFQYRGRPVTLTERLTAHMNRVIKMTR